MTTTESTGLSGQALRYLLTVTLHGRTRALSVDEIVAMLEGAGHRLAGRPSKTVSDALRWEVRRGRIIRIARGRYAAGAMPASTLRWMRGRLLTLLADTPSRDGV